MKTKKILSILILIIIILLAFAVFKKFYNPTKVDAKNNQLPDKQVASIVKKVSKLMLLPVDEKPVIVPITNADELIAEQRFYIGSENGDYIIVYPNAKKAIIYREDENKLINVGPVIIDQPATSTQQSAPVQKEEVSTSTKKDDSKKAE